VGAPHERDRVFVLAYAQRGGRDGLHERVEPGHLAADAGVSGEAGRRGSADELDGGRMAAAVADSEGVEWRQGGEASGERPGRPASRGAAVADPAGEGRRRPGSGPESGRRPSPPRRLQPRRLGATMGDPDGAGLAERGHAGPAEPKPPGPGERTTVGDAEGQRRRAGLRQDATSERRPSGIGFAEPPHTSGRGPKSGVGRGLAGIPGGLDGHRWPSPPGPEQYPGEPPRTVQARTVPYRGQRLKALGNTVVPQQGALAFAVLWGRMVEELTATTPTAQERPVVIGGDR
jgi:hypothetical protein